MTEVPYSDGAGLYADAVGVEGDAALDPGPAVPYVPVYEVPPRAGDLVATEHEAAAVEPEGGGRLVFVDECETHTSMTRLRARAPKGERARGKAPRNRGPSTTLLASVGAEGMGPCLAVEGATTKAVFEAYVEGVLLPSLSHKLKSCGAAKKESLRSVKHRQHKGLNNRAENSHQSTRERERRLQKFKSHAHAQRFLSVYGPSCCHFRPGRHCIIAPDHRPQMSQRFQSWRELTGVQVIT